MEENAGVLHDQEFKWENFLVPFLAPFFPSVLTAPNVPTCLGVKRRRKGGEEKEGKRRSESNLFSFSNPRQHLLSPRLPSQPLLFPTRDFLRAGGIRGENKHVLRQEEEALSNIRKIFFVSKCNLRNEKA